MAGAETGAAKTKARAKPADDRPKRPTNLAHGRWLGDFPRLSAAEKRLVACCARGDTCHVGSDKLPDAPTKENCIRAGLIRFLLLGGDGEHPVHENGVHLGGAWISDRLNLDGVTTVAPLKLLDCKIAQVITAREATLTFLGIAGSHIAGLRADGMVVMGDVILRHGFCTTDEVRLLGAQIGGDLDCSGGNFSNTDENGVPLGDALSTDRMVTKGSVFLCGGFSAIGEVRLLGAQIGSNLDCTDGSFSNADKRGIPIGNALSADRMVAKGDVFLGGSFSAIGEVRFLGAQIEGDLDCDGGRFRNTDEHGKPLGSALSGGGSSVGGALFIRGAEFGGIVDLVGTHVGSLVDDRTCWPNGSLVLDGFHYDRIGTGSTDGGTRIAWLLKQIPQHLEDEFRPQPWEQVIKVLRDMGHPHEASKVAIAKQQQWRKSWRLPWWHPRRIRHKLYGSLAGYGYRPLRTLGLMALVCYLGALAHYAGRYYGLYGPTSPPIQLSKELAKAGCGAGGGSGNVHWTSPECPMPPEYTSFQPFMYSLDLMVPFVDLQQEHDWAPIVSNEQGQPLFWGYALRFLMWFQILFGWVCSILLAAVAGNLIKKD